MATDDSLELDPEGFLPRGLKVSGKAEFAAALRRWYEASRTKTIGEVGGFGGRPCIEVVLGSHQAVLNVDTTRAAVQAYLDHVREHGSEAPWHVIANRRGTVNKVMFSDDPAEVRGWYLYLRKSLAKPGAV